MSIVSFNAPAGVVTKEMADAMQYHLNESTLARISELSGDKNLTDVLMQGMRAVQPGGAVNTLVGAMADMKPGQLLETPTYMSVSSQNITSERGK